MTSSSKNIDPNQCLNNIINYIKQSSREEHSDPLITLCNDVLTINDEKITYPSNSDDIYIIGRIPDSKLNNKRQDVDWFLDIIQECESKLWVKRVRREISSTISPANTKIYLSDIAVKSKGPDDAMYDKYEILRKFVSRGLSIMEVVISNDIQDEISFDCVINANKKFCGITIEDEDDLQSTNDSKDYFIEDPTLTTSIVAMEKINGEAAHFTGRFIGGQFYLIAGSKNVHIIFQTGDHIDLYVENRYSIAVTIARSVLVKWLSMTDKMRSVLAQFLHLTKTTVVCEIMMPHHQHVVNFGSLDHNKLVVIALTPPPEEDAKSLTALSSETTLSFFVLFGFDVPDYIKLPPNNINDHIIRSRNLINIEGFVYYHENKMGYTIGQLKLKSSWYIHLRALRQQATYRYLGKSTKPKKPFEEAKKRSRQRMSELQKWLYTSEEQLAAWDTLSDHWFQWLEDETPKGLFPALDIRDNYPTIWQKFYVHLEQSKPELALEMNRLVLRNSSTAK